MSKKIITARSVHREIYGGNYGGSYGGSYGGNCFFMLKKADYNSELESKQVLTTTVGGNNVAKTTSNHIATAFRKQKKKL